MRLPPKWPHEPDGGYPIGAKSPGDDPVQFEAAVARLASYARVRALSKWTFFVDLFFAAWMIFCLLVPIAGAFWFIDAAAPRVFVENDEIALRPNAAVHWPFLIPGGGCFAVGLYFLPGEVFPWLREAWAWREMNTASFRANVRNKFLEQGAVAFDPRRALLRPRGMFVAAALTAGIAGLGVGICLFILGERDVHRITPRGFTSVSFWTSQETRHSVAGVKGLEIDCSLRRSGRSSRTWVAEFRYSLSNGESTVLTIGRPNKDLLAALPAIDDAVRAAGTPVTWSSSYDDKCIQEFTRDRDRAFARAFERFMHFVE